MPYRVQAKEYEESTVIGFLKRDSFPAKFFLSGLKKLLPVFLAPENI
jgi:hypothetical protein